MGEEQAGFFNAEVEEIAKQLNPETADPSAQPADMAVISTAEPLMSETLELSFEPGAINMPADDQPNLRASDFAVTTTNYSNLDVPEITTPLPTHSHEDAPNPEMAQLSEMSQQSDKSQPSDITHTRTDSDKLTINEDILDKATAFLTKINHIKDKSGDSSVGTSRAGLAEAKAILASMNANFGEIANPQQQQVDNTLNAPKPDSQTIISELSTQAGKTVTVNSAEQLMGQKNILPAPVTSGTVEIVSSGTPLPTAAMSVETPMPQIQTPNMDKPVSPAPKPILSAMASPDNIGDIIVRAVFNNKRAMIQIDPPEMGRVMMDFDFSEGFKTVVSLQADTEAGRRALQSRLGQIHALLTEQGFSEFEVKLEGPKSNLSNDSWSSEQQHNQGEQSHTENSFGIARGMPDIEEVDAAADINQEIVTDMIFNNRLNLRL